MAFRVALTFDAEHPDRPTETGAAEVILAALAEPRRRATFFVQGRWAEAYPSVARMIRQGGHLVGSHSHFHAQMTLFNDDGFERDIRMAERTIERIVGVNPSPWFRFPWGAGRGEARLTSRLHRLGYRSVHWGVEARDWDQPADYVERAVLRGVLKAGDGAVVLLHTWPTSTRGCIAKNPASLERSGRDLRGHRRA